jgi:hypothetical protein
MLSIREIIQLQEGEQIQAIVRRHASTIVPGLILGGLLIALPFFFLFPLIHVGFFGAVIISLCLAGGLFYSIKTLLLWDANTMLITDRRVMIVHQNGPWDRRVIEWPIYGLSVSIEQPGWFDSMFHTGQISLLGFGSSVPTSMDRIANPERIAAILQKLRDGRNAGFKLKEL